MDKATIKLLDENGNLLEHDILFSFDCEELGKHYIAYEDNESISVASYESETDLNNLKPVVDEDELKMVNDVLKQIMEV